MQPFKERLRAVKRAGAGGAGRRKHHAGRRVRYLESVLDGKLSIKDVQVADYVSLFRIVAHAMA